MVAVVADETICNDEYRKFLLSFQNHLETFYLLGILFFFVVVVFN